MGMFLSQALFFKWRRFSPRSLSWTFSMITFQSFIIHIFSMIDCSHHSSDHRFFPTKEISIDWFSLKEISIDLFDLNVSSIFSKNGSITKVWIDLSVSFIFSKNGSIMKIRIRTTAIKAMNTHLKIDATAAITSWRFDSSVCCPECHWNQLNEQLSWYVFWLEFFSWFCRTTSACISKSPGLRRVSWSCQENWLINAISGESNSLYFV